MRESRMSAPAPHYSRIVPPLLPIIHSCIIPPPWRPLRCRRWQPCTASHDCAVRKVLSTTFDAGIVKRARGCRTLLILSGGGGGGGGSAVQQSKKTPAIPFNTGAAAPHRPYPDCPHKDKPSGPQFYCKHLVNEPVKQQTTAPYIRLGQWGNTLKHVGWRQ